jgi:hypothetical protein
MIASRTTTVTVTAASLAALVGLTGCGQLSERRLDFARTEEVKITEIVVEPGSGEVVVRTAPVSNVQVKRVVRYRGDEPGATYRIEGTTLIVDTDCGRRCSVSYDISAPEGVAVRGSNGSGDMTLTGVSRADVSVGSGSILVTGATGTVRAQTGSGDVTVTDAAGAVSMRTGSGTVVGRGLGGDVTAQTGSGDITLALSTPHSVWAQASSGSVDLSVPAGSYRVKSDTGSGDRDIGVSDDPSSPIVLELRTGSGDISVAQL